MLNDITRKLIYYAFSTWARFRTKTTWNSGTNLKKLWGHPKDCSSHFKKHCITINFFNGYLFLQQRHHSNPKRMFLCIKKQKPMITIHK